MTEVLDKLASNEHNGFPVVARLPTAAGVPRYLFRGLILRNQLYSLIAERHFVSLGGVSLGDSGAPLAVENLACSSSGSLLVDPLVPDDPLGNNGDVGDKEEGGWGAGGAGKNSMRRSSTSSTSSISSVDDQTTREKIQAVLAQRQQRERP